MNDTILISQMQIKYILEARAQKRTQKDHWDPVHILTHAKKMTTYKKFQITRPPRTVILGYRKREEIYKRPICCQDLTEPRALRLAEVEPKMSAVLKA